MTDDTRLSDPLRYLTALPPESAVIVRARNSNRIIAQAEALKQSAPARMWILAAIMTPMTPMMRTPAIDGFHLPELGLRRWRKYQLQRRQCSLVTAAVHSRLAAWRASLLGVDAVLLSPVFATSSHPGGRHLGLYRFARIAQCISVPVIALGGISAKDVRRVRLAGASGIAGIGLFAESDWLR